MLFRSGSGGVWGTGFGLSKQKLANLPIQYTDFIFSVYAEEFGLVGSLLLLGLIAVYGGVGLWVAVKTQSVTVRLVATGSVVFLVGQSLLNVGVATGGRSEEHTSELQSLTNLVCRLLLEKKKQ